MNSQSNQGNPYGNSVLGTLYGGGAGGMGESPGSAGGAGGMWWAVGAPPQVPVPTVTTTTIPAGMFQYVDPDTAYRAAVRAFIMGVVMLMKKADIRKFMIDELHFMALGSLCAERGSNPLSQQQLRILNDVLMNDIESRPDALMGLQDGERVKFKRASFNEFTTLSVVIEADGDLGAREISKALDDVTAEAKYDELQEQKAAHG